MPAEENERRQLGVLFVSHTFPPADRPLANVGGMQRVAVDLHGVLSRHPGVALRDVVLRSSWRWIYMRTPPYLLRAYRAIEEAARSGAVDVVLFSSMIPAALAAPLRGLLRETGVATLAIAHGQDVTWPFAPYRRVLEHAFEALDGVAAVSRATGEECVARGLPPSRLHVVPNGIREDRFAGASSPPAGDQVRRRELLRPFGSPPGGDAFLLCSVGRQVERKGFGWFVDAVMPELPDSIHYWLAGSGPEAGNIREAASRRGLEDRVRLLGAVPDDHLHSLYRGSDLFIMPNVPVPGTMEGFGVVMLEAGLCGLPTIASRLEGIQDVITEEENGHLVRSGHPGDFRDAILRYYADPGKLDAARVRASDKTRQFRWPVIADCYVRLMAQLVHDLRRDSRPRPGSRPKRVPSAG